MAGSTSVVDCQDVVCRSELTAQLMAKVSRMYIAGLLIVGLFGNVYCAAAFLAPMFRVPSAVYLEALALSDMCFLLTLGVTWMNGVGTRFLASRHACAALVFFSYCCCFVSAWLTLAVAVERYLLANGRADLGRDWRRVVRTLIAVLIGSVLLNCWVLFVAEPLPVGGADATADTNANRTVSGVAAAGGLLVCDVNPAAAGGWYPIFNTMDMLISFTAPFIGVVGLNAKIGYLLCKARALTRKYRLTEPPSLAATGVAAASRRRSLRRRAAAAAAAAAATTFSNASASSINDEESEFSGVDGFAMRRWRSDLGRRRRRVPRHKLETRVARLLVMVSLAYPVLNLPSYVHRVVQAFSQQHDDDNDQHKPPSEIVYETVAYLLFYTQYSVNFFLYTCHGCAFGLSR